ncbi:hypothetical protein GUJ93_ZPchr0002g25468 [Zizania palustris]|uniref:Uncharacterized protein n=1 Tax=Zizania palustris TaxID=103762 RepID=A0A8J5S0F4_ZIZPA|nr:hypothetical protein GUJ93_ZPchr0002g25468 [Zizania palustris]
MFWPWHQASEASMAASSRDFSDFGGCGGFDSGIGRRCHRTGALAVASGDSGFGRGGEGLRTTGGNSEQLGMTPGGEG